MNQTKLTEQSKSLIRLILRSPDIGDGWRQCSSSVYQLIENFPHQELIEADANNLRVRLSERGQIVQEYLG